ncbi:LexA-binding, inner membrane-associated putative hydrolase [Thermomonospora echinospora]|uniref:LexA-binding, inner membrane-associated putative hydrolase n=1 Tax=Thermomonospora echinospora TaxID=1992 RepID=A0A1H5RYU4_9ACTN|nr:metal-dependent hydrolase [Thermomonospora echinospora]SEF43523.1 LexA-binding, inner membrane-associated putative hydrolase [Thermomonospora echinospora]
MMGRTHALSGAVAWLGAVPFLSQERLLGDFAVTLSPAQVLAGTVVCAGAALLPDVDHHNGRIANTMGPVSKGFCKWVGKISGGHRQATHSILFAVGVGLAMDLLATHFVYGWWAALFVTVGFGLRGIGLDFEKHEVWSSVADCAVAALAVWLMRDLDMSFVGYAVTLGCLAHVAGDCLTPRGCPVFWPAKWRVDIPLVPRTDGKVERWVIAPALTLGAVILAVRSVLGDEAVRWLNSG